MADSKQQWQVKRDGASLERLLGTRQGPGGQTIPIIAVHVGTAGERVTDLNPAFVERWEAGEVHARSLVDKLDADGQVVQESSSSESSSGTSSEEDVQALQSQVVELEATASTLQSQLDDERTSREQAEQQAQATQVALEAAQQERDSAQQELSSAQEAAAAGGGDNAALVAVVNALTVAEVNKVLDKIDDAAIRQQIVTAEEAGQGRSGVHSAGGDS